MASNVRSSRPVGADRSVFLPRNGLGGESWWGRAVTVVVRAWGREYSDSGRKGIKRIKRLTSRYARAFGRWLSMSAPGPSQSGQDSPVGESNAPLGRPLRLVHVCWTSEISVAAGFARRYALVVLWWSFGGRLVIGPRKV